MKIEYVLKVEQENRESLLFDITISEITAFNNRITVLFLSAMNEGDSLMIDFNSTQEVPPPTKLLYWLNDRRDGWLELGNTKLSKFLGFK